MDLMVLAGAPGCGKGEQGRRLIKSLPQSIMVPPMSELLQRRTDRGDQTSLKIIKAMNAHDMVDDSITTEVFFDHWKSLQSQNESVAIVDGFPRTVGQYRQATSKLWGCIGKIYILYFAIHGQGFSDAEADRELVLRMRGRSARPVSEDECLQRLKIFRRETVPFLKQAAVDACNSGSSWIQFITVSGWPSPKATHDNLLSSLEGLGYFDQPIDGSPLFV